MIRVRPKILITGGSGLLALNWARCLRDRWAVTLGLHERRIQLAGAMALPIDLRTVDSIYSQLVALQPDIVIHTVALTNVERCEQEPQFAREVNVTLAENVAQSCHARQIKLVHISTDHLFSGELAWSDENCAVSPCNVYARTKADAEVSVLAACPDALVVRTNFYGWGTPYRASFSDFIISSLRVGNNLTLFEDVFYNPILIDSLVAVTQALVERGAHGIYHVVGDERISKYTFGCSVARRFDLDLGLIRPGLIQDQPQLVQRPNDMSLVNAKACKMLGIEGLARFSADLDCLFTQEMQGVRRELANLG